MAFPEEWLETILEQERKCHLAFFGQEFDLSEFKKILRKCGQERIEEWGRIKLEAHFLPLVPLSLLDNYPGWKIKPDRHFYEEVAGGKVYRKIGGQYEKDYFAHRLEGSAVLIDTRCKPIFHIGDGPEMYEDDADFLAPLMSFLRGERRVSTEEKVPSTSRFDITIEEWQKEIRPSLKWFITEGAGASARKKINFHVRLERFIEANVIPQLYPHMPRKEDHFTNSYVWYEEAWRGTDEIYRHFCSSLLTEIAKDNNPSWCETEPSDLSLFLSKKFPLTENLVRGFLF